nr:hypothetical protein [Micromonospora sp. DSM 115978]
MKPPPTTLAALASAVLIVSTLTACGTSDPSTTPPSSAASEAAEPNTLDTYDQGAEEFYASFMVQGRSVESYARLEQGVRSASVVVLGTVVRVEKTREFQGEIADDRFPFIGVVIRPTRLAGALAPEFQSELTVEFDGATGQDDIANLTRLLPVGHQGLWILRKKGDPVPGWGTPKIEPVEAGYFRIVSPQGLFIQGRESVATPLMEILPGASDMAAEGREFQKMSDLVSTVSSLA